MKKYINRKLFLSIIPAAIIYSFLSCTAPPEEKTGNSGSESALQTILKRGTIRAGTTGDFNPMSFKDPATGNYAGYDIELVELLASDMGVTVEWVATDWKNLVTGIAAGKYDITTGASYNMGRAKTAGYTLPVVDVGTVPLVLKKNLAAFKSLESINSSKVTVATTLGTVFADQAKQLFPDAVFKAVESPARDYQEVLAGRAQISVTSNIEASQLIRTYPELAIVPGSAPFFGNAIGLLVPQSDQILKNYIDTWIIMKEKSGYFDRLKKKWLSLE